MRAGSRLFLFQSDSHIKTQNFPYPRRLYIINPSSKFKVSLRNASYTQKKISLGIEVTGGGQAVNDLGCEFYDGDYKFASSAGGFIHTLGDRHEYVTVETDEVSGLPDILDLRVKVLARSNPLKPHDLHANFRLELHKK